MTIFLIRHGETEWNREGCHQGRLDSPGGCARFRSAPGRGSAAPGSAPARRAPRGERHEDFAARLARRSG
jgi:Histidine phosphatase superfamily (branch 1)